MCLSDSEIELLKDLLLRVSKENIEQDERLRTLGVNVFRRVVLIEEFKSEDVVGFMKQQVEAKKLYKKCDNIKSEIEFFHKEEVEKGERIEI